MAKMGKWKVIAGAVGLGNRHTKCKQKVPIAGVMHDIYKNKA